MYDDSFHQTISKDSLVYNEDFYKKTSFYLVYSTFVKTGSINMPQQYWEKPSGYLDKLRTGFLRQSPPVLSPYDHWVKYGIPFGVQSSPTFCINFYKAANPTLESTLNESNQYKPTNYKDKNYAFIHFYSDVGSKMDFSSALNYDPKYYATKYDIANNFNCKVSGCNYRAIAQYYTTTGLINGEQGSSVFDPIYYKNKYELKYYVPNSLSRVFILDASFVEALIHFLENNNSGVEPTVTYVDSQGITTPYPSPPAATGSPLPSPTVIPTITPTGSPTGSPTVTESPSSSPTGAPTIALPTTPPSTFPPGPPTTSTPFPTTVSPTTPFPITTTPFPTTALPTTASPTTASPTTQTTVPSTTAATVSPTTVPTTASPTTKAASPTTAPPNTGYNVSVIVMWSLLAALLILMIVIGVVLFKKKKQ